eukprot:1684453-Karenia_brevis.AAC.1
MAMEQSTWQQQSDTLTHQLQLMQDEAENYRLDKVQAQRQLQQIMQRSDEERISLKSEIAENQKMMKQMAEQLDAMQLRILPLGL